MYAISQLNSFGSDSQKFAALNDADKKNLLACRDILFGLLRAVERKTAISEYVTPELAKKYRDSAGLAASLLDPETSLIAVGVSDFAVPPGGREIHLHFYAVTFSDGAMAASEKSAILNKVDSTWRVGAFD